MCRRSVEGLIVGDRTPQCVGVGGRIYTLWVAGLMIV